MTDYTISSKLSNETVYACYRGRFWRWDGSIWKESHLMTQKFERARAADKNLTPQAFLTNGAEFAPLDEYEIDCAMLDALENAKPCKNAPIEPVEEHPTPSAQCSDAATAAESQTAASPAAPEGSSPTTEKADAVSGSNAPGNATGKNAAPSAGSGSSSDKYLTFIPESMAPKFDYSGLSDQTVADLHLAEKEYQNGKKMAARGYIRMGEAVGIAHDVLVANCDKHNNQYSEDNFRKWCLSIGITKDTAYRLLKISSMFESSSPRQQDILQELPPSLLYAAAKPSAPPELVGQVKSGDITTYKEYQELLAQLKAEKDRADAAEKSAQNARKENAYFKELVKSAEAQTHKDAEKREEAESRYESALADISGLKEQNAQLQQSYHDADESRIAANLQRQKAEAERDRAEERAKNAEDALKKQPITAVIDEEEIDRRAAEKAWGLADARNAELAKDNANLKKQVAALRSRINDDAQADFEQANYCASLMRAAWDNSKASYSRLVGEDLESTFQTICGTLNSIMEEASLLCRQPPDYDGGDRDE